MRPGIGISGVLAAGLLLAVMGAAQASGSIGSALSRPALSVSSPEKAFLVDVDVAGSNIVAVGERGLILLSSDGGRNWRQSEVPVSTGLNAVHFIDAQRGMAVGHGGTVLGTRDGGESWQLLLDGLRAAELALASAKMRGDQVAINEAQRMVDEGPDKPFLDVLMFSSEKALIVGAYGLVFMTSDGGSSWVPAMQRTDNPDMLHFYAIRRQGQRVLLVGEQGLLNLSENSGLSFHQVDSPYGGSFFTAELERDGSLLVAGLKGNIWRSRDAGQQWQQLKSPVAASITASHRLADGSILLASQAGVLLKVSNSRVVPVSSERLPPLNAFVPTQSGMLLLTADGIRHSSTDRKQ